MKLQDSKLAYYTRPCSVTVTTVEPLFTAATANTELKYYFLIQIFFIFKVELQSLFETLFYDCFDFFRKSLLYFHFLSII